MDWLIQKSIELGVNQITPIITEWTDVKINQEQFTKKQQHWQGIAIQACQQCGQNYLPDIDYPVKFEDFLSNELNSKAFLFHPYQAQALTNNIKVPDRFTIIIGPEGGFTELEVSQAIDHGVSVLSMDGFILRADTAALTAIANLSFIAKPFSI